MGEDCTTWMPHMQFGWQSPNLGSFDVGRQNDISATTAIPTVGSGVPRNETMPAYAPSVPPNMQLGHSSGWFYCLPRFRQGFTPAPSPAVEAKLPIHVKCIGDKVAPCGGSASPRKQFLVIDQTGGQTTVVYSSNFGSPNACLGSWHSKWHGADYLNGNGPWRRDLNQMIVPTAADKVDENPGTGVESESEMHEDTEEINALLYSDTDGYSTGNDYYDNEVTSTGHSPSAMTTHDVNREIIGETAEEVASFSRKTRKRKLSDGYQDDIQFIDTASSLKLHNSLAMEDDDAESRCSNHDGSNEMGSLSPNKKIRKEKIREVLSALQSIMPDWSNKDPVTLLDDAIRCLKSLKLKAKELGLNAL